MRRRAFLAVVAAAPAARALAPHDAPGGIAPARLRERDALLARAEAALAARKPGEAMPLLERAAQIAHAPDTELAIVRCRMQAGEYRQALSFAAHAAGAHLEETAGAGLYAWLLNAGGQPAIAARLLREAQARNPQDRLLKAVAAQLERPWPVASGPLLQAPARMAPYAAPLPGTAVVGSGTLLAGGRVALVPAALVHRGAGLWVRNGLGDTVEARVADQPVAGVARLALSQRLPDPQLPAAARDPFPGSVAMAIEYAPQAAGTPAWPLLRTGFIGAALPVEGERRLGIALPPRAARGGPVLDQRGALAGIAIGDAHGDRLVGIGPLRAALGPGLLPPASASTPVDVDGAYELGLRQSLQLLRRA